MLIAKRVCHSQPYFSIEFKSMHMEIKFNKEINEPLQLIIQPHLRAYCIYYFIVV